MMLRMSALSRSELTDALARPPSSSPISPSRTSHQSVRNATSTPDLRDDDDVDGWRSDAEAFSYISRAASIRLLARI